MIQAGAVPTTAQHFVYELQQDWDRQETYQGVVDIMKAHTAYGGEQESTEQVNCSFQACTRHVRYTRAP